MRKHPIILGIVLLVMMGVTLFLLISGLGILSSSTRSFSLKPKIGIVLVEGIIRDSQDLIAQIEEFSDDSAIHAVVLRINSPGGGVASSQEIHQAIRALNQKKKVVASLGSIAASGGYLIACAADHIIANPGTVTGSISAVMHFADIEDLMRRIGIRSSVIKSGKYKDMGSPTRKMTDEEKDLLQSLIDDIYMQFVQTIADRRNIPLDGVKAMADGRIFSGRQAVSMGLVDALGGLNEAMRDAAKLAGVEGHPQAVYSKRQKTTLLQYLMNSSLEEMSSALFRQPYPPQGGMYLFQGGH